MNERILIVLGNGRKAAADSLRAQAVIDTNPALLGNGLPCKVEFAK